MTVPWWPLIPGIPLALIGSLVVAFVASMLVDEIRLDRRRRRQRPVVARPTLAVLANPDHNPDLDEDPFDGLVVDPRDRWRWR
ncbi:hypothetical protein [Streptosporangium jomthongense]|uniref:Uncharacterized protein n=1 Tax=Streptosporangium jomthongense TaxID=1193683 RepID=A0ABV8FDX1_9ACTN